MHRFFILLALSSSLLACQSTETPPSNERPTIDPEDVEYVPPPERDAKLKQAMSLIEGGDSPAGLEILLDLSRRIPKDEQVSFHLARCLQQQGQMRAARKEYKNLLSINPSHALGWLYLGDINQRLGEHNDAIAAYLEVSKLVPKTIDPLRRIASNLLRRGKPHEALDALAQARERLLSAQREDALVELLTARAFEDLGNTKRASDAIRTFLELSMSEPGFEKEREYYQNKLREAGVALADDDVRDLLRIVRSTLAQVTDGSERLDSITKTVSPRLKAFDESVVFVTVSPPSGLGRSLSGRGQRGSLLTSLGRALEQVTTHSAFSHELYKRAALRLSIVTNAPEPITLSELSIEKTTRWIATPAFEPGRHGLVFDAGDLQPYALPADLVTENLGDLKSMLDFAASRARLSESAWRGRKVMRFTAREWVQARPESSIIEIDNGEPLPRPAPSWTSLWTALGDCGDWLLAHQADSGAMAERYDPLTDRLELPRSLEFDPIELDGRVSFPIRAVTRGPGVPELQVRERVLELTLDSPTRESLKAKLLELLSLSPEQLDLAEGDAKQGLACTVTGTKAALLRLSLAQLLSPELRLQMLSQLRSFARLFRRTARPEYLRAGLRAARFVAPAVVESISRSDKAAALLAFSNIDDALLTDARPEEFRGLRDALYKSLMSDRKDALRDAPGLWHALSAEACLRKDLIGQKSLRDEVLALSAKRDELSIETQSLLLLALSQLSDAQVPPAVSARVREIATGLCRWIRDPSRGPRDAGGLSVDESFPRGQTSALAGRALAEATRVLNSASKPELELVSQLRLASLTVTSFVMRHQLRREHAFLIPNPEGARGAFREGLFSQQVSASMNADAIALFAACLDVLGEAKDGR
jgi:tetratricopeptide (TPR) repeat protein